MKERGDYNHYGKSIGESFHVSMKVNGILMYSIYQAIKEPVTRRVKDRLDQNARKRIRRRF